MTEQPAQREAQGTGFAYFMIRVQRPVAEDPRRVSGLIERLGTGEKSSFRDGAELLELLSSWPHGSSRMQAEQSASNLTEPESS